MATGTIIYGRSVPNGRNGHGVPLLIIDDVASYDAVDSAGTAVSTVPRVETGQSLVACHIENGSAAGTYTFKNAAGTTLLVLPLAADATFEGAVLVGGSITVS